MSFAEFEENPEIGKVDCPNDWRVWAYCPNLKFTDQRMNGEKYECKKCGRTEFFNYDEIS